VESGILAPQVPANVVGYWCDVGAKRGKVRWNRIFNIGYVTAMSWNARGILIESRCDGYTVEGNEISRVGGPGVEIRNANDAHVLHNTVYDTPLTGVHLKDGARAVIRDNIFSRLRYHGIAIQSAAWQDGGHTIDYNYYDRVGQPGVISGMIIPKTLAGWQQACRCEANGRMGGLFVAPGT
jgi:hypothetical protein